MGRFLLFQNHNSIHGKSLKKSLTDINLSSSKAKLKDRKIKEGFEFRF